MTDNTPTPSEVNKKQVGGSHYKTDYEHWDLVLRYDTPYLIGCATKYITRIKKGDRIADLEKAIHYLEKAIADGPDPIAEPMNNDDMDNYAMINELPLLEHMVIRKLIFAQDKDDYKDTIPIIHKIIEKYKKEDDYKGADHE